jgi:nucleotide-binding universal stress UspA family protein
VIGLPAAGVVVGTDGSASGRAAVEWAAAEAAALSRRLSIVHAQPALVRSHQRRATNGPPLQASIEPLLDEAVSHARAVAADIAVSTRNVVGGAVPALLGQRAELLVLGGRDRRADSRTGGPVCLGVASYSMCPVVVVRLESPAASASPGLRTPRRREAGRVVVGVGGSSRSPAALEFAFRAAAQRGVGLTALVARPPNAFGDVLDEVAPSDGGESTSWSRLMTGIARVQAAFPTVRATTVCRPGTAADVLVEESAGAALLVVGTRDRSLLGRRLFGSVSHLVLDRAGCPVAIVRV